MAIDRTLEPSPALSRAPVVFLWLCSADDKPKVALSVELLLVLLAGGSGMQVEVIQTGLYERRRDCGQPPEFVSRRRESSGK